MFREMPLLKHLDLSHNLIATWSPRVFMVCENRVIKAMINTFISCLFSFTKTNCLFFSDFE